MKLVVFDELQVGVLGGDETVVELSDLVSEAAPPDRMTALISAWEKVGDRVAERSRDGGGRPLSEVTLRAPQPSPATKVVAAPVNYRRHQEEMGGSGGVYKDLSIETIETYAGFIKATSSIVGPDEAIELPPGDRRVDHEAELGVVIGRTARNVSQEDALDFVFGYLPLLDITVRGKEDRSFRKSFDTFTPIGPAIVSADEVPDPEAVDFSLTVNGEPRQQANTRDLIFGVAKLIELYSAAMTLMPGDLIATGTPEGVGPIVAGDQVVLEIDGVGRLTMPVRASKEALA
jgi:2-keto-4-pentenoate hydratase/2-oxohepta-3-ene-1,7-dioic acid hydratase in catechol pathway